MNLRSKLYALTSIQLLLAIVLGVAGLVAIRKTSQGLTTVYNDRVVPLQQLKAIADDYAVFIIDAANKANAGIFSAEETAKSLAAATEDIRKNWKAYMATALTPEEVQLAKQAEALFTAADDAAAGFRKHLNGKSGSLKGMLGEFDGPLYATIDPISGKITELVDLQLRVAGSEYQAAQSRYTVAVWFVAGLLLVGAALGGFLGWAITRSITRPITAVAEALTAGAEQTGGAATQVSSSSQSLAEGASEQAASLEETSSSLEEMSSMTQRNTGHAQRANELAKAARAAADRGAADMQAMASAMDAIRVSSDDIAKILKTIDEIAFQTNLLALNAAVEAARAGEAGAGFAVVADEVRGLAQRAATAAKETAKKIDGAIARSAEGVEISQKVAVALSDIVTKARQVDELVSEVAVASREQSQGISQINTAVSQMDKVTQNNAASAEESASAAEELNAQAESMKEAVEELLCLVNGQRRTTSAASPFPTGSGRIVGSRATPEPQTPVAPASGNDKHAPKAPARQPRQFEPELAAARSRSQVPIEGDFKAF